jgi:hypothetical protein
LEFPQVLFSLYVQEYSVLQLGTKHWLHGLKEADFYCN